MVTPPWHSAGGGKEEGEPQTVPTFLVCVQSEEKILKVICSIAQGLLFNTDMACKKELTV